MPVDDVADSWEEAVRWYRRTADHQAVLDNYFDLPVIGAAQRYAAGTEFFLVQQALARAPGREVLDLGAGNGIASYALAKAGWSVHAVEPAASDEVGTGAIHGLSRHASPGSITVYGAVGEGLPLETASVHAVHARQVLHHLDDLEAGLHEVARVLVPGGLAICTREHVADDPAQLAAFLEMHPLHARYGGENAHPLDTYRNAMTAAGLAIEKEWGPWESAINAHPATETQRRRRLLSSMLRGLRDRPSAVVCRRPLAGLRAAARDRDRAPGRLYTFLLRKNA